MPAPPSGLPEPEHVRWTGPVPALRRPVLIAAFEGWNDAGDAASNAARFIADRLGAEPVADIDPEPFYDFIANRPQVNLDVALNRSLTWPANRFQAAEAPGADRDAVVLIGTEPQLRWRTFCEQITAAARALGTERVITLGALLAEVPHSRPVEVYGTTEDETLMKELDLSVSTYEGPTGIVGVLAAACRDAGFSTMSFWSAVPSYMPAAPSPKATLALIDRVRRATGLDVDTADMERTAADYETRIAKLVAEDDDTAEYVAGLERAWDADRADRGPGLDGDPGTLVAEVEQFLRQNP